MINQDPQPSSLSPMQSLVLFRTITTLSLTLFVVPLSSNYQLNELTIGGGTGVNRSTNFAIEGSIGDVNSVLLNGTTYNGGLGFGFTQMAAVPPAPTFTNPNNYYNKLHAVIQTGGNPSDTRFALAISSDNFATTNYVKADQSVGASLTLADYQTYASWGSGTGFDVVGLSVNTSYQLKVKALHGDFSESGFGPSASAATVNPSLTFDIDVAPTDTTTSPPFSTSLGSLTANTIVTSPDRVWVTLETNGASGGKVYVSGVEGGLRSARVAHLISAITGDLSVASEGFGAQGISATQGSGGPLAIDAPFNGSSNTIGITSTTIQSIFSTNNPISTGRASFVLKAKSAPLTPASGDYLETLRVIASANF
jgi:hypothetical protein